MHPLTDDAVTILRELVGFDTTSRNSNMPLIEHVADRLRDSGIGTRIIASDDGEKANLFATAGPKVEGGVVLSGHTDVVPVDGQDWSNDPFELTERDARLYGRGTADMKGFLACALALAPRFSQTPLRRPLHLAFSYDEEVGCLGVGRMIEFILAETPEPGAVIVGEPSCMGIASAHKGICALTTTVRGLEAHSSRPRDGANAIAAAAEIVSYLYRLCDELAKTERDERFDPPFTTFNTGRIAGGTAVNIVAGECVLDWEFRPIPGADPDAIVERVNAFSSRFPQGVRISTSRNVYVPPFDAPDGSPAEEIARHASGRNDTGTIAFVTEASLFSRAGFPAVICGPGDIAQAHQPDEFIEISQLSACLEFLDAVVGGLQS